MRRLAGLLAALVVPALAVTAVVVDAETGGPISGAVCRVRGSDVLAVTDDRGVCFVPVTGRRWMIAASAGGYEPDSVAARAAVRGEVTIRLFRDLPRFVRGRVVEAVSGRPLPAEVRAGGLVTTAADDGTFRFDSFPKGQVLIGAVLPGFVGDERQVCARGNETTEVLLRLRDTANVGTVSGTVTDLTTGAGIAGAELLIDTGLVAAVTDSLGSYQIAKVPAGEHWLVCRVDGYGAQKMQFRVLRGWEVVVCFRLRPTTGSTR